jgi:serine/threonine protein kinase
MPAPSTVESLLELVRKSGVVEAERLDDYLRDNPALPANPRAAADQLVAEGLLTHFQRDQLVRGKWRGFTLGKYRILERLGRGGMSSVFLAEHVVMHRLVALKVLPENSKAEPTAVPRFHREARAVAVLDHPNVIRAHDVDCDGKVHFLVMEFVDGVSLQALVEGSGPLEPNRACHYAYQAAAGLHSLHQAGLVHRDVKPGNILVDRAGTVKLLDLGLARFSNDDRDRLTRDLGDEVIMGTADYLAPEQGLNSHEVDARADIYGLGATLYFLLAGQAPFEGRTVPQKLLGHQLEDPPPLASLSPGMPEALAAIVSRMMAKQPVDRYQSAAEVAAALAPWVTGALPPLSDEELPRLSPAARGSRPSVPLSDLPTFPPRPSRETDGPKSQQAGVKGQGSEVKGQKSEVKSQNGEGAGQEAGTAAASGSSIAVRPAGAEAPIGTASSLSQASGIGSQGSGKRRRRHIAVLVGLVVTMPVLALSVVAVVFGMRWAASLSRLESEPPSAPSSGQAGPQAKAAPPATSSPFSPPQVEPLVATAPVSPQPRPSPPQPRVERIIAGTGQTESHATIAAALAQAGPGDRVLVYVDTLEERLFLKGVVFPEPGVTLQGAAGASGLPVAWIPPSDAADEQPLLDLSEVAGLRVKGFRMDGRNRLDYLVTLGGPCPGVQLEDVHMRGFRRAAVQFKDCAGEPKRPVVLAKVRIAGGAENAFGLVFRGSPDSANREVQVRDSRLEGPLQAGVQLAGPVASAQFQGNRFHKLADAFQVPRVAPRQPLLLTVASNTFADAETGLHFLQLPPPDTVRLSVSNNLFLRTRKLAHVDDFLPQPANIKASWIWYDEPRDKVVEPRYFRTTFQVPAKATVSRATLDVTCDQSCTAWVNGQLAGKGELGNSRRVAGLDVTGLLRPGKNLVAIQAINRRKQDKDKTPMPGGLLAQLSYLTKAGDAATVAATQGKNWRASKKGPEGWQNLDFDDADWVPAKVFTKYGSGSGTWQNLSWDSTIEEHFPGAPRPVLVNPKGNIRDKTGTDGFPWLDLRVRDFALPADPADDLHFLRYPRSLRLLSEGGTGKSPVGAPPVE